jgi:tetratricopeptide (TPR) repeat protein
LIRTVIACVLFVGVTSQVARADEPAPTKQDLAAAKKAFDEGNALYKAGKLDQAVERLKESYRLSHNAFLLYNIGHIYDQLGQKELVLFYFKKFLVDAPANAPLRPDVTKRVAALEQESSKPAEPEPVVEEPKPQTTVELKHTLVDSAPPGVPCDITASVPADANLTVTLFYRPSGDVKFIAKPMVKRNDELVAHVPAAAMAGSWIQYYIEVRDAQNNLVTRNGKSTSPNLLAIENTAQPHFFADLVEPGESTTVKPQREQQLQSTVQTGGELQVDMVDTGPPFARAKWIASGTAVVLFGTSLTSYLVAKKQHDLLLSDSVSCGSPPCRQFDSEYDETIQGRGQRYDAVYKITLGAGVVAAGVAGYFWYRSMTAKRDNQTQTSWLIAPTVSDDFAGATAAARF